MTQKFNSFPVAEPGIQYAIMAGTAHGLSATKSGPWFILAAAVLWGTTGTTQALAPAGAQPEAVGALRLAIGGVVLLVLAAARGALPRRANWPALATALAVGGIAAYQLCFFAAVARTGVAVGTIVGIGSSPILAGLLGFVVRGERPGWRWAAATIMAVLGVCLLILSSGSLRVDALGILLAFGAGGSYALYTLASKQLLEDQPPETVMAVLFCLGALLLSPLLFTTDLTWLAKPQGLAVAIHLGLVATALSYTLFARGLMVVPVATAVTLTLAEPLTAGLLGIFVLGERLTLPGLLGIALVFGGIALLTLGISPHPKALPAR